MATPDFHGPKDDFHHIKAEIHNVIKPEIHAVKQQEYHLANTTKGQHQMYHPHQQHPHQQQQQQQHQGYYNNVTANGPPNQYGNHHHQYYQNEFMDSSSSAGVDPAVYYNGVDSKNQHSAGYYENMSNYHQHHLDYQDGYVTGDACNNFAYPQYFDGTNGGGNTAGVVQGMGQPHQTGHHQSTGPVGHSNLAHHSQMAGFTGPAGGYPANSHHGQTPTVVNGHVGAVIPSATTAHLHHQQSSLGALENSNSSSDFNFLSNLANDFAPEYYQLS